MLEHRFRITYCNTQLSPPSNQNKSYRMYYSCWLDPLRAKMVTVTMMHNPPSTAAKPIRTCRKATAIVAAESGSPHAKRLA